MTYGRIPEQPPVAPTDSPRDNWSTAGQIAGEVAIYAAAATIGGPVGITIAVANFGGHIVHFFAKGRDNNSESAISRWGINDDRDDLSPLRRNMVSLAAGVWRTLPGRAVARLGEGFVAVARAAGRNLSLKKGPQRTPR